MLLDEKELTICFMGSSFSTYAECSNCLGGLMNTEEYKRIMYDAELADYGPVHGNIVMLPYGMKLWKQIQAILSEMLDKSKHEQVLLPLLIPEHFIADEMEYIPGLKPKYFAVNRNGDSTLESLAIRPTSETVACYMFSKWIDSYRKLPLRIYQWANIARWEANTQPFIKETEIQWLEGHTVHATHEDSVQEIKVIVDIFNVFLMEYLAIPIHIGTEPNSRKFLGSLATTTFETVTLVGRALQLAAVYDLGQIFTRHFDVKYRDKDNTDKICWMTDWGLGFRLIGALILLHSDERGLRLPVEIAPIQVAILELRSKRGKSFEIHSTAHKIFELLERENIRVWIQDVSEQRVGDAVLKCEQKGIPIIIPIGDEEIEKDLFALRRRDKEIKDNKVVTGMKDIVQVIKDTLKSISQNLYRQLEEKQSKKICTYDDYDDMMKHIDDNWIEAAWCGTPECEKEVVNREGQIIRFFNEDSRFVKIHTNCIVCGRKARYKTIFAKNH